MSDPFPPAPRGRPGFLARHPRLTIWLIAGVALGGIVMMCLTVGLVLVTR